jgi:cytochrome c biogenesis protein
MADSLRPSDSSGAPAPVGRTSGAPALVERTSGSPGAVLVDSTRPTGHYDAPVPDPGITQPRLNIVGYVRFFWRQLTSMRTALLLLLLLALAAIPGSLVPQVSSDPNGVIQYKANNPTIAPILDKLGVFTTYYSVWFSAIYLLLFISLIGCVIPRTKHHFDALRARPPKTPARLERLEGFTSQPTDADAATAITTATTLLKRQGYRTQPYASIAGGEPDSVSAERGYLRETGNLVFHIALIGVLITVAIGGGFGYTGQRVVVEGFAFTNSLASYDSFNPGRFFSDTQLDPYSIALNSFKPVYEQNNVAALGQPIDYTANVTSTVRGQDSQKDVIKVNSPLSIGGTEVYLLGNGYAPVVIVRDASGNIVFNQPIAFLPQDANLTSLGIIKIPDGLGQQLGMRGFLYPTAVTLASGAFASNYPDLLNPTLTLEVFAGDLGLDNGVGTNAYALNTDKLTEIAGRKATAPTLELHVGGTVQLPNGLGSIELASIPRFASLDVHHDPSSGWVLLFAVLVVAGLVTSLFIPRRRLWVKFVPGGTLEYAGLARGDDPGLNTAVAEFAEKHADQLGSKIKS